MRTAIGLATATAAAALLLAGHAAAQDRPFAGTTIHVGTLFNAPSNNMLEFLDRFEAETGIKVTVEQMAAGDLLTKATVESVGQTGYFDIVRLSPNSLAAFAEPGWILPLNDLIAQTGFDKDDIFASSFEALAMLPDDERIWGLPQDANVALFAYRTDLFADPEEQAAFKARYGYDLVPPETTDQWLDVAEFFTRDTNGDGEIDLYGFGFAAKEPGPAHIWAIIPLWTFGGEVIDEATIEVELDSPEAVAAFEWALELQKFQPPGVLAWEQYDQFTPMAEGRLATSLQFFAVAAELLDPEKAPYHDRIAFIPVPRQEGNPRGYATGKAHFSGGALSLHAHSRNPEAAWAFMSWMLGEEMAGEYALAGTLTPRKSVMEDPAVVGSNPAFGSILPVFLDSLEHVAKGRPKLPESTALLNQLGHAWHEMVAGNKTPAVALADAQANMERILKDAGY
jgi:multiple sugar transport system substrate-binding protein